MTKGPLPDYFLTVRHVKSETKIAPKSLAFCALTAFAVVLCSSLAHDLYIYSQPNPDVDSKVWLLDLDFEQSLYTGMSVVLIAFCSLLLLLIGTFAIRNRERFAFCWIVLSSVFAILAADEFSSLHEKLVPVMSSLFNYETAFSLVAICALTVTALCFLPFLKSQPKNVAFGMLASGIIFVSGAAGVEILAVGYLVEAKLEDLPYRLMVAAEEGLEGLGMILFMWTLLTKLDGKTLTIVAQP